MNEFQRRWRAAVAENHRQQRRQRGKRNATRGRVEFDAVGPGMMRRTVTAETTADPSHMTVPPSPGNGPASHPGPPQDPQRDHPHHPGTPGTP